MSSSQRLLPFEGLRGIAALVVVVWHLRLTFYATAASAVETKLGSPSIVARTFQTATAGLYNGAFAVWLFWIMSAFVLSLQFFRRVHETPSTRAHDYLEDAFFRRYPRLLLPVLASVVFAYVIHALGWMQNVRLAEVFGDADGTSWLATFYRFPASALGAAQSGIWQSFFAYDLSTTYNSSLWTMEKEFYGSLFLFAFLGLLGHRNSRFLVYPLVALVNVKCHLHWLNAFVAGIGLCDLFVNRDRLAAARYAARWSALNWVRDSGWLAAGLWILIIVGSGLGNLHSVSFLILGCAAVALTLLSTSTQRVLSSRPFVFLGKISFGLYLIHLPVICSFSCWAYLVTFQTLGARPAALFVSAATCVVSVGLGYLLYIVADRPALGLSRRLSSLVMSRPSYALKLVRVPGEPIGVAEAGYPAASDVYAQTETGRHEAEDDRSFTGIRRAVSSGRSAAG